VSSSAESLIDDPVDEAVRITRMSLTELKPAPHNPRTISDAALKGLRASIRRFGLVEPIVWNKRSGQVVGGHQRIKALQAEGVDVADVVIVDLDETDEKALNLALNNPAIAGEFTLDVQALIGEVQAVQPGLVPELRFDALLEQAGMFEVGEAEMPELRSGDREPFQQMTFTLADSQAECVKAALAKAKAAGAFNGTGNENSNGNALARIVEDYLGQG